VLIDLLLDPGDLVLTDLERGGELLFLHQSLSVSPGIGVTLLLQAFEGQKSHFAPRQLMSWQRIGLVIAAVTISLLAQLVRVSQSLANLLAGLKAGRLTGALRKPERQFFLRYIH
jgi:hypothetical protein